jgi:predicted phage terminase large subunit-like protein
MTQPGNLTDGPKLTPDLIHGFVSTLLLKGFDGPTATPDFHREWWELFCSDYPQIAIAAPRQHAKTSCLTISYTLAATLFRAHDYVLIVSDSISQAAQFLGNIREELVNNQQLISLFGVSGLLKDNETDVIAQCKDGYQFRISARGSEQKLRGLLWHKKRPNLIIMDDGENDEIVLNEERRAKFKEWLFSALIPTLSVEGKIRIVGTVLHMDSMLERLLPPVGGKEVIEEPLKSYWRDPEKHTWVSVRYKAHNPDFSHILWGDRYNKAWFQLRKRGFTEQGIPEKYNQEYLNYPIDEESAYFRRGDFRNLSNPDEYLNYFVGCDLAISEKKGSAYTTMVVVGMNCNGKLRVKDIRRFRGDAYDIINELFSIQHEYNPECFFIEEENIARTLGAVIDKEMADRGIFLNIELLRPVQDKIQRARPFQALMRSGAVEWDMSGDWYHTAFTELVTFPRSVYKDQVDACSLIGLGINSLWEAKTKEEMDREDQEELSQHTYTSGTCVWTGY